MAVKYPALGVVLIILILVVAIAAALRTITVRSVQTSHWRAHADRIRRLPRFQALLTQRLNWTKLEVFFVVVALVGAIVLASRPIYVTTDSREMRNRDVMLCLDVSGSMTDVDAELLATYVSLVEQLRGERIGLVIWDSSAVTVFPLTDDYDFIVEQLWAVHDSIGAQLTPDSSSAAMMQAVLYGDGSSLIGDGLMSCAQRFDQAESDRPRTIILATDNELAGSPFFTLDEAMEEAAARQIMVFAIAPSDLRPREGQELQRGSRHTGGDLLSVSLDDSTTSSRIVRAIERQQRQAIATLPRARSFDLVWPGGIAIGVGLIGMSWCAWRRP